MTINLEELSALLHLASPALPIGGYSYSQGLESAINAGLVHDAATAELWIHDMMMGVMARSEAPLWWLCYDAWAKADFARAGELNDYFLASRESKELRLESEQMGWSLGQIAQNLGWGGDGLKNLTAIKPLAYLTAHSYACVHLAIAAQTGLVAYGFAWLENQVAAALKTMSLGQMAGQKIFFSLRRALPDMVTEARARAIPDLSAIDNFAPMFSILSARHEMQYSRLFRS
ncbi:MAG: urease accessory UreF family protein [Candidatus Symbiobacter sp.]|nr:urease accessory UreF family protein [Candidatus Symbiobacter sp.]